MFSERLENLIKAALQDGVLTEQEKVAIIKRAGAEGEDINEVDIYIQSLVQKRQQELAKNKQEAETARIVAQKKESEARMASEIEEQKQRDTIMRKCPVCGARIPVLSNVCPDCKHVIDTNELDGKMMEMIKKITAASRHMTFDSALCRFRFKGNGKNDDYFPLLVELEQLYGDLPKVKDFLLEQKLMQFRFVSNKFRNMVTNGYSSSATKDILNFIIDSYGSLPQAQALIHEYQEKLNKQKVKRYMAIGGPCIVAILIIYGLYKLYIYDVEIFWAIIVFIVMLFIGVIIVIIRR